jgi:hypothetical protein
MAQPGNPIDLVARTLNGPPTVIQFVDAPMEVMPLSRLVIRSGPRMIATLPVYDVDGDLFFELKVRRPKEPELPRFECSFPDSLVAVSSLPRQPVEPPKAPSEAPPISFEEPAVLSQPKPRRRSLAMAAAAAAVVATVLALGVSATEADAKHESSAAFR